MELILGRSLTPRSVEVMIEYAYESKWNDLLPFLMMAANGPVDAAMVNRHLLFRPETSAHGSMVLAELEGRGLLQRDRPSGPCSLTTSGKRTLQRGRMRIRRRNICRLLWIDDPLFRHPLLSLTEVHRTAGDLKREARGRAGRQGSTPLPISALKGVTMTLPLQGMEVEIMDVSTMSREAHTDEVVQVEVREDDFGAIVLVTSDRNNAWGRVDPSKEIDALGSLLEDARLELDVEENGSFSVPMGHEEAFPEELESMSLSISRFGLPSLKGLGCFEYIEFKGIGVRPRTEDDAVEWANVLLREKYQPAMDDEQLRKAREDVAARFAQWFRPGILLLMMADREELENDER